MMSKKTRTYSDIVTDKIKYYRISKRMTQKELANKLGKSESAVRMWELGKAEPNLDILGKLADVLNINIAWLFLDVKKIPMDEIKEARAKATSALYSIRAAIEHIIYKFSSSHIVLADDVDILEELIHIWRFAKEAETDIDGIFSPKKRWIIDNEKVLKLLHEEKKESQKELADYLNIPVRTVELMLHGLTPITLDTAVRIALFLNCQIEDIIRYTGEEDD